MSDPTRCRQGVLALGDSITNGGGELQWGVALQSWALWTARGLGLPYTPYAVDGATADGVALQQVPAFQRINADPDAVFDLGCLYVGTNDVRSPGFEPSKFATHLDFTLSFMRERCDRLLVPTIPLDMGRPRNSELVESTNLLIEAAAGAHGARVLDLRRFGGRGVMMADHVHPTAFGQLAIAERALDLLALDGLTVRARPGEMVSYTTTRRGRLRGDLPYAYRHTKRSLRDWRRGHPG
jgi:lysophospholipase L1-like esterase